MRGNEDKREEGEKRKRGRTDNLMVINGKKKERKKEKRTKK